MKTHPTLDTHYDVAIIGAGPAGLAAAAVTAGCGLSTVLLDENPGPGGQIYRAITSTPMRGEAILDRDYWDGRDLVLDVEETDTHYVPRRHGLEPRPRSRDRRVGRRQSAPADGRSRHPRHRRAWSGRSRSRAGRCRA